MIRKAFIDGQNLHLGIKISGWSIDYKKLRVYLKEKYLVDEAYYFLGVQTIKEEWLYRDLIDAGFILMFREHDGKLKTKKKGNVDTDIVFHVMRKVYETGESFEIVLISGDGDYVAMVKWLIEKGKFRKILFPNGRRASSLYKKVTSKYYDSLDNQYVREKIEHK